MIIATKAKQKETAKSRRSRKAQEPWRPVSESLLDPRVQTAMDYMVENYDQKTTIDDLADVVNLSGYRLAHLFKKELGLPPIEYLTWMRMDIARHLLETTRLRIKEIMVRVGYKTHKNFATQFKRAFGVSAAKYRKKFLAEGCGRPGSSEE